VKNTKIKKTLTCAVNKNTCSKCQWWKCTVV